MNMILFAILGGAVGWTLTVVMPRGGQRMNIAAGALAGVAGALLGGWLLVPLFHTSSTDENWIATTASLVSALGAALSFGLVSLARRGIRR